MNSNTIIIISEDDNGDICWATSWDNALEWLLDEDLLDANVKICVDGSSYQPIGKILGNNWADKVRSMTMEQFNDLFDCAFYARKVRLV